MTRIYGKINNVDDISRINCIIRDEMLKVQDAAHLTELKKRSDYLCTLTYSPFWKKRFGDKIGELRERAKQENIVTVQEANDMAIYRNFDVRYDPWGKEEAEIEAELKNIPRQITSEVNESVISLQKPEEILENLRNIYCEIRKAAILCPDEKCLDKIKHTLDIMAALPNLPSFTRHFDENRLEQIDELITVENDRSIFLLNIISEVKGYEKIYDMADTGDETAARESIEKILQDEAKAETYIPTESRYKGNAKVLWLVYYLPKRKRDYAKRIYLPATYKDLKVEGPDFYLNRFGHPVYGLLLTYKTNIKPTTIHLYGKAVQLPERWITKQKIISVPVDAKNIRITENKPESAMDIA